MEGTNKDIILSLTYAEQGLSSADPEMKRGFPANTDKFLSTKKA